MNEESKSSNSKPKSTKTNQSNQISKKSSKSIPNSQNDQNEEEIEKPKFDPYIPDKENPYNNLNYESQPIDEVGYSDYIVLCYHCKNPIKIEDGWKTFECGNCHKLNQLPRKLMNELYFDKKLKNVRYNSYTNHLDMILPLPYVIVTCPFCHASNKVKNNVQNCLCFICERPFEIDYSEDRIKPLDKVSLNPNSKYYRYQSQSANPKRVFPSNKIYRQSSYFFPEPVNYDNIFPFNIGRSYGLNLNNFKWNNNHQMVYVNPNYFQVRNLQNTNINHWNHAEQDDINELNQMSMKRENERANLYQKLFFMNGK